MTPLRVRPLRWHSIFWGTLCALPLLLNIVFILRSTSDAIYHDMYGLLIPMFAWIHGAPLFGEFIHFHAGHLPVLPRLFAFFLHLSGIWSPLLHFLLGALVAGCSVAGFLLLLAHTHRHLRIHQRGLAAFTVALLFLFWAQFLHQHLTWGMLFVQAFFLAALTLLAYKPTPRYLGVAAVLCTLATFSFGHGIFSWIALVPILFSTKHLRPFLLPWLAAPLLMAALYFFRIDSFISIPGVPDQAWDFLFPLSFVFNLIAIPLTPFNVTFLPPIGIGILVSCLLIPFSARRQWKRALPWYCLLLFGLVSVLSIASVRSHMGDGRAFVLHYTIISGQILIALFCLLWLLDKKIFVARYGITFALIGIVLVNLPTAITRLEHRNNQKQMGYSCLRVADVAPDSCVRIVHPHLTFLQDHSQDLRILKLLQPAPIPSAMKQAPMTHAIPGKITAVSPLRGDAHQIQGWVDTGDCRSRRDILLTSETGSVIGLATTNIPVFFLRCDRQLSWSTMVKPSALRQGTMVLWLIDEERNMLIPIQEPEDASAFFDCGTPTDSRSSVHSFCVSGRI